MVRNTENILKRGQKTDERIIAIHAFNLSGIIVGSTDPDHNSNVPGEVITTYFRIMVDLFEAILI